MRPFEKIQENMVNKIEANMQALTQKWSWNLEDGDHSSVSKVCKIYSALSSIVSNPDCGPMYAAIVLNGSTRKNLVALLRGVLAQAQEEHGNYTKNMDLRCEEIKRARTEFLHPKMFANKKNLFGDFMACVQRYYSDDSKIKMLEKMESMVLTMITQFTKLYDECFEVYARVSQNLIDTFHENYQTLSNQGASEAVADPFIIPLMTVEDMKDSLDSTVDAMNLGDEMTAFHSELFKNAEVWSGGDEKKIAKKVSKYLIHKFSGYTQKTLTDYLQIRFETDDAGELTDRVYKEILLPLSDKATPLFWKEPSYQITTASPLGYCSVPDQSSAIQAAAGKMTLANPELQQITSKLADRIFLLRCTCGVPMFAYNGIESYLEVYGSDSEVGKHLYERTERDLRDWRSMFNLVPFSKEQRKTEKMKENSVLYDKAVEEKIIRQRPEVETEYQIVVMPSVKSIVEQAETAINGGLREQINTAIENLETFIASMEPERLINIPNDGMAGHEETVRKDHVLASAEITHLITEELEKKEILEKTKAALEKAQDGIGDLTEKRQVYFDALMTGVILCKGRVKVVYEKEDEFGFKEEISLSEPSMKPYGSCAPIYQGFQTFCELGEEERLAARTLSDSRKDNIAPEIATACGELNTIFVPAYLQMIQASCKQQMPEMEKEIIAFVKDFLTALKNFCMMYGV